MTGGTPARRRGFTLTELLVVIAIIGVVAVTTLSVVVPAFRHRGVTQATLQLQAAIAGAKDRAVRDKTNAPHGVRLLADPVLNGQPIPGTSPVQFNALASNRIIPIELAPDYSEGKVSLMAKAIPSPAAEGVFPLGSAPILVPVPTGTPSEAVEFRLHIKQSAFNAISGIANTPTQWYWNIRQGDRIRLNDSGRYMAIAGPVQTYTNTGNPASIVASAPSLVINPDRFVNSDIAKGKGFYEHPEISPGPAMLFVSPIPPSTGPPAPSGSFVMVNYNNNTVGTGANPEVLFIVNGQDDDGDGYTDNSFDGIDNDGDGLIDPGFDGIDNDNNGYVDDPNELYIRVVDGSIKYDTRIYAHRNLYSNPNYPQYSGIPSGYNPEYEYEEIPAGAPNNSFSRSGGRLGVYDAPYTILRRPVVAQGARETELASGVVVDLTGWNSGAYNIAATTTTPGWQFGSERSRVPVDPVTQGVDVLVTSNGSVVQMGPSGIQAVQSPFYQFWIAEREDVFPMLPKAGVPYLLPMPQGTPGYPSKDSTGTLLDTSGRVLKSEHRLLTLFTRTGQFLANTIDDFDATGYTGPTPTQVTPQNFGVNRPFIESQLGQRETP